MSKIKVALKRLNLFTVLAVVVCLALATRLNALTDSIKSDSSDVRVMAPATAQESEPEVTEEAPPPIIGQGQSDEDRIQAERGLPEFPVVAFTEGELEVLQSLSERRRSLEERERRLKQKEALLQVAEQEVDSKIRELSTLRTQLEDLLDQQEKVQEERLRRMVKIYENMKPAQAATIFNQLEMEVLLSVISRMSERKSAPIFASMNPQRAQEVTIRLVEQTKLPELPQE